MTSARPTGDAAIWYARHRTPGGQVLVGVSGDDFPDAAVVDLPGPPARPARWLLEASGPGPGRPPHRVVVARRVAPDVPLLWTVLLPAGASGVVDLVAFSVPGRAHGDVLDPAAFAALGLAWSNQVAAVRWRPATGLVEQVYVAPTARRRGVAGVLLLTAAGVRVGQGWPALHGDGRRTDLGQAWVDAAGAGWRRARVAERTARVRPMTPPAAAVGVPARLLVPTPD
ncbi:hypothetical protein [Modestobacter sp. NPDC049651]|uniref:hypothetical protein n=1 Tax=unclassified Modestobacter TaxID=2643866 RepID=UPI00340301AD